MWKFMVDAVHDFVSSLQPDVGRGFLHISNVFLLLSSHSYLVNICIFNHGQQQISEYKEVRYVMPL